MSQPDDAASPGSPGDKRHSSAAKADQISDHERDGEQDSDQDNEPDTFEDAVDAGSVRSLTKRSVSASKSPPARRTESADDHSNYEREEHDSASSEEDAKPKPRARRKSSSLSKRISSTSNLDNVNLDDDAPPQPEEPRSPADKTQAGKTISLSSITSALPSMPWSPPVESPSKSPVSTAVGLASPPPVSANPQLPPRKLSSPFSWLSRSASKDKEPTPLPTSQPSGRRNTASSVATITSNPEMMLSRLEEEKDGNLNDSGGVTRNSLKDRFKLLRMREEAGVTPIPTDDDKSGGAIASLARNNTATLGLMNVGEESPGADKASVPAPDDNLAPGTASGISAGPSALEDTQVNWDLWQAVVYEGPAAVARTSPEELNRAIANGIPSAIRGVIWQVLAQSKNDELEAVYKELATRGTDQDKDRHSNSTTTSSFSNGNLSVHSGDAVASSASSIHSDQSALQGAGSPIGEKSVDSIAKAQAASVAERKRRGKEDAATIQKLEKIIRRDLGGRTNYSKHAAAAGLQEGLFGVCKAYALFDDGVGYTQGMNFLIMPLLFNMPEQEAFCLLVRLMNQYNLRDLFIQDMPGLHLHLYQFERLLEDLEPALYCHLHRRGISPHLYATQWFLTLFAYRFPLQLVLRIYDLIFSEGLSAVLRFGIVLMQKNSTTLLEISDMQQLTVYLKDKLFDVYIDKDPSQGSLLESGFFGSSSSSVDKEVYRADQLVKDASEVKLSPETLKIYTTEWEEKTRGEKEREAELQDLRTANQSFALKVRKFEERVEAADREQAALATELVHTKVENQEIKDENESLKGQVRELRLVIEQQPLELEEKWKPERDNLMKSNEKVHEENQKLETELAELEEELVQTKMHYAEINSQHEALTRKWAEVKRQFT